MCADVCVGILRLLTHIKLKSLILKGVCAASSLIMLLQNEDPLSGFRQNRCCCQTSHTAANHHRIQSGRYSVHTKPCMAAHFNISLADRLASRTLS